MAKEYNVGDRLYLPVWVTEKETNVMMGPDKSTVITDAKFHYAYWHGKTGEGKVRYGEEGLLLTAEEIATVINTERDDALEELKSRNAELEALLKEVTATRDEAIKQNNELIAENKKLKAENDEWQKTARCYSDNAYSDLELTRKLRDEVANLKAERCALNGQVGKNLAEIQALSSDVHFFKETCNKQKAEYDELKGKYDELDSVNHEQAEKIRKLDKALTDLKQRNDKLRDENTNLTFLLEDQPEKEATKTLHVILNDGTEIEFKRYTSYDYRTNDDMFVVKDGEKYIAGFLRGDKPTNIAYWWTE